MISTHWTHSKFSGKLSSHVWKEEKAQDYHPHSEKRPRKGFTLLMN